jgi:hypothetical protein
MLPRWHFAVAAAVSAASLVGCKPLEFAGDTPASTECLHPFACAHRCCRVYAAVTLLRNILKLPDGLIFASA